MRISRWNTVRLSAGLLLLLLLPAFSGCAYVAIGAALAAGGGGGGGGKKKKNLAPQVQFTLTPNPAAADLFARIDYDLFDENGHDVDLVVEYSTDGGSTYSPAVEGSGSDGVTGLAASRAGTPHVYVWNFFNDLYANDIAQLQSFSFDVTMRFSSTDEKGLSGPPDVTSLRVGNRPPVINVDPVVVSASDTTVVIDYTVTDEFSDDLDLVVEFSTDGFLTAGLPATPLAASVTCDGLAGITSSPTGVAHCFEWDRVTDIPGAASEVVVRLAAVDTAGAQSIPADTQPFRVGNDAPIALVTFVDTAFGVNLEFILQDSTSDPSSIAFAYSTDAGVSFTPSASVVGSVSGLATSPAGETHSIAWNALADLGTGTFVDVILQITPDDGLLAGLPAESFPVTFSSADTPFAFVVSPAPDEVVAGDVRIDYLLVDFDEEPISIAVDFSTDFGFSWSPATESTGPPSEGITGLASTRVGTPHVFVWDSLGDLPGEDRSDLALRITPSDALVGTEWVQGILRLDNNAEPSIQAVVTPAGTQSGDVIITYQIADPEGDPVDLLVEYSLDGGVTYPSHCHEPPLGSDGIRGLSSSPGGTVHTFVWDTDDDLGEVTESNVVVRITPWDDPDTDLGLGAPDQTLPFAVDNDPSSAPPEIVSITPTSGPDAGGNTLTITGENFIGGTTVDVGTQPLLNLRIVSLSEILGDVPAYVSGSRAVDVTVTTSNGSDTLAGGYTYIPPGPSITSVTPPSGDVAGGTVVQILTANFGDDFTLNPPTTVTFGGLAATGISGIGPSTIECTTPAAVGPGFVDVFVDAVSGDQATLVGGFEYTIVICTITAITPNVGTVGGGTMVTIDGSGFRPGAVPPTVTFGGRPATVDLSSTDTQIICTTPLAPGLGMADVEVVPETGNSCLQAGGFLFENLGNLDPSFGGQGWVLHDSAAGGNSVDRIYDVALDASGRIVASGMSFGAVSGEDMVVWRFEQDGTLDVTFGGQGFVVHDSAAGGGGNDRGWGLAIDASGRILVAGDSFAGSGSDMVVWAYDATGTLDPTFGTGGIFTHDSAAGGGLNDEGRDIVIDGSGRIVVAGLSGNANDSEMAVWRLDPGGTLDPAFGGPGFVTHDAAAIGGGLGDNDEANAVIVEPSGRIVVAGLSQGFGGDDLAVWALNDDGTFDVGFGGMGWVTFDDLGGGGSSPVEVANDLIRDPVGRILVTGRVDNSFFDGDMGLLALDAAGALDPTYASGGLLLHDSAAGGNSTDLGLGLAIDPTGKTLVSGWSNASFSSEHMTTWRVEQDGTLDTTFAGVGYAHVDILCGLTYRNYGYAVTTLPSGRIVVGGEAPNPVNNDATIWQIEQDGRFAVDLGPGPGFTVHANAAGGNSDDYANDVIVDPGTGRLLVVGTSFDSGIIQDMIIWAYMPNGLLDPNFGSNGGYHLERNTLGPNGTDEGHAIVVDGSGRILVAGTTSNGTNADMALWAYDSLGNPDLSFGASGSVTRDDTAGGAGDDIAYDLLIDGSGRIVVCGKSRGTNNFDMAVWRFFSSGGTDDTFANFGSFVHDDAAGGLARDEARSIILDGGGRLVVAGWSDNVGGPNMVIWRLDDTGALDPGLGGLGWVVGTDPGAQGWYEGHGVAEDSTGRIVVTGETETPSTSCDMIIWRYNPDGTIDSSFGGTGSVLFDDPGGAGPSSLDRGWALAIDPLDRIVVAGEGGDAGGAFDMAVWRVNPDGSPDIGFSAGGAFTHDNAAGGGFDDQGFGMTLDPSGKIIVVGDSWQAAGDYDMVVWRLE